MWSVENQTASPALTFVVGQFDSSVAVTSTSVGQTPDGHLEGVSSLSITNGVVSTYSATLLDYTASLYYDSDTVATLFDDGQQISQGVAPVDISTAVGLRANTTAWHDYDLQTDHYAIAYFVYGGYYQNPFYWGNSCYAETGDCTLNGIGGYAYWISAASIYLGSTVANQTNVPQDGSLPTFSDEAVWGFLGNGQTPPSGPFLNFSKWKEVVAATIPALELAKSVYKKNGQPYDLPMFLDLVEEKYTAGIPGHNLAERIRTYLVKDTTGRAWDQDHQPITIFERFIKVFGSGGLPDANNPAFGNEGWNRDNKELTGNGYMVDLIRPAFSTARSGLPSTILGYRSQRTWIGAAKCDKRFRITTFAK